MKEKLFHWISGVTIFSAMALILFFGWMMFYPFKVIEFDKDSFQTLKKSYQQGETFTYRVKYHKYYDIPATVIRSFEDGIVYQLPVTQTQNPTGNVDFTNMSIEVPKHLPPGTYTMKMSIIYKLNPVRDMIYNMRTNEFNVVGSCESGRDK